MKIRDNLESIIKVEKPSNSISGILPSQKIRNLIDRKKISSSDELSKSQVQPASLDLRLGTVAHRVRASFLPGVNSKVLDKVDEHGMHTIDLANGSVLEKGCVYIVPLLEELNLDSDTSGAANPKSSTGRLDVFTRLIADNATEFDRVPRGYTGPLFAEISPRTFSILARKGDRLSQIRFRLGSPPATDAELRLLHERTPLVHSSGAADIADGGVAISVDLTGNNSDTLLGYKAKHHSDLIDLSKINHYDPFSFWDPIFSREGENTLILNPEDFYILASKELVSVPPDYAAELIPYDPLVGEFRVHYAGFFDPGFGFIGVNGMGTRAVLEVRSRDVPFVLEHGQIVGRLSYEKLIENPDVLYGANIGSSYSTQGLALSKHFHKKNPC